MINENRYCPRTIAIYSVGLLGGSLGLALRASGYKGRIVGLSSESGIKTALERGCIDEGYSYDRLDEVMQETDCLFLCSPIQTILSTIKKLGALSLPKDCIITDVGSTKVKIMDAAKKYLPSSVHFIGGHPMAGSEKNGPRASDPTLFQNAMYVLTPTKEESLYIVNKLSGFLQAYLQCTTIILDPESHDKIAAMVSHVPHLLAVALVNMAHKMDSSTPSTLQLAAGGFRDMTRIASSSYTMWRDILTTNKECIAPLIDDYIATLVYIKQNLDNDELKNIFDEAAKTRSRMATVNKG